MCVRLCGPCMFLRWARKYAVPVPSNIPSGGPGVPQPIPADRQAVLRALAVLLESYPKSNLSDYGLPDPDPAAPPDAPGAADAVVYDAPTCAAEAATAVSTMTDDQLRCFSTIDDAVASNSGGVFVIHAPGGHGKSFIINALLSAARGRGQRSMPVATSAIAATSLRGGTTAHSQFKIPIDGLTGETFCKVPERSKRAAELREVKLILFDEAFMLDRMAVEAVDRTMRKLRSVNKPFGDCVAVFAGDVAQLLPIVRHGGRAHIIAASLLRSPLWEERTAVFDLRENMRVKAAREALGPGGADALQQFVDLLHSIGRGTRETHPACGGEHAIQVRHVLLCYLICPASKKSCVHGMHKVTTTTTT